MQDTYHGIGRHTYCLLLEMAALEIALIVLCPNRSGRFQLEELEQKRTVRLVRTDTPVVSVRSQWELAMANRRYRPDAMLVPYHLSLPLFLPIAPTVTVIHDCIFERRSRSSKGPHPALMAYEIFTRAAIKRSAVVATVSEATRGDLRDFYGLTISPSAVVQHGVGREFFATSHRPRPDHFDLPKRYILHVGAQRPHKNQQLLLQALALLGPSHRDVGLVLVGDGNRHDRDDLTEVIDSLQLADRVCRLARVGNDDLLALYANAEVFAYPSLAEGFGLPLLEAMAVGVPVVASDIPVIREVTRGAVQLLDPSNASLWAARIADVLDHPGHTAELVARGRAIAGERTWTEAASRTLSLLDAAAATRGARTENR